MKRYQIIGFAALILGGMALPAFAGLGGGSVTLATPCRSGGGDRQFFSQRGGNSCGSRFRNRGNNQGNVIVINGGGGYGYGDYNNSNYLGYPPWYRLNYYTPWMSDYEDGTAWTNIPSSHAADGYAFPSSGNSGAMSMGYNNMAYNGVPGGYDGSQGGNPELAGLDVVVGVQRELRRRGFYQGVVNGISDAATRAAIRSYEANSGLPVTGVIGLPLLRSLGFF